MTSSVNDEPEDDQNMHRSTQPTFGMRITRLPPEHRPRIPRKLSASEAFEASDSKPLKTFKGICADYGRSGVLRQKTPPSGGGVPHSETPPDTHPPQNRQETALESGTDSGRPDVAPEGRSGNFKGALMGLRRSSTRERGEDGQE